MELLALRDLSKQQLFILQKRIDGESYQNICTLFEEEFNIKIYDNKISKAIKRGVMGYSWESGISGGQDLYLCTDDLNVLKEDIINSQMLGHPLDCHEVIDEAQRIKLDRLKNEVIFLRQTNSH